MDGLGSCDITFISAITHHLTATYSGDLNFIGSYGNADHDVTPAAAHHLVITGQPTSGMVNVDLSPALTVQVRDEFENDVDEVRDITVSLYDAFPETAWLSGATTLSQRSTDRRGLVRGPQHRHPRRVRPHGSLGRPAACGQHGITIHAGSLLSTVATGDPSWQNHIDGVDTLFTKTGSSSSTKYTLRATNPGTFKYELALQNETGTTIHAKGKSLPNIVKNGVSLTDRNGATTTVYLTVPSMPSSVGTPSGLSAAQMDMPAFVLSGSRPVRAYPTEGSDDDHEKRHDEHTNIQVSWVAEYPSGVTSCANVPDDAWTTTALKDGNIVRCIKIDGLDIPKHGEALRPRELRVPLEGHVAGWGSSTSDATKAFRAGFSFRSLTTVQLDDFNTDLLNHSHDHWSRLPSALKAKLLSDFQALWNKTYSGSHALGLVLAGQQVTAIGGFLFDAGANGLEGITVRAFSSKPSGDACSSALTAGTASFMAEYTTGPDGFYFIWQTGVNNDLGTGTNTLPSGYKYYLALCDAHGDRDAVRPALLAGALHEPHPRQQGVQRGGLLRQRPGQPGLPVAVDLGQEEPDPGHDQGRAPRCLRQRHDRGQHVQGHPVGGHLDR